MNGHDHLERSGFRTRGWTGTADGTTRRDIPGAT
jgi:hypothetical protein